MQYMGTGLGWEGLGVGGIGDGRDWGWELRLKGEGRSLFNLTPFASPCMHVWWCLSPFKRRSIARAASRSLPSHPRLGIEACSSGRVSRYLLAKSQVLVYYGASTCITSPRCMHSPPSPPLFLLLFLRLPHHLHRFLPPSSSTSPSSFTTPLPYHHYLPGTHQNPPCG